MLAIFLDIETTGLDPTRHRPIEIALKIYDVMTGEKHGEYQSVVRQSQEVWEQHDPVSIEINGFTWEKIKSGKEPEQAGDEIIRLFTSLNIRRGEAVFICQNPAFDRGFFSHFVPVYTQENLEWPYHWLDLASMYWTKVMERGVIPEKFSLSKNAIAAEYGLLPEAKPHRAMNGVDHLVECYQVVLDKKFETV